MTITLKLDPLCLDELRPLSCLGMHAGSTKLESLAIIAENAAGTSSAFVHDNRKLSSLHMRRRAPPFQQLKSRMRWCMTRDWSCRQRLVILQLFALAPLAVLKPSHCKKLWLKKRTAQLICWSVLVMWIRGTVVFWASATRLLLLNWLGQARPRIEGCCVRRSESLYM